MGRPLIPLNVSDLVQDYQADKSFAQMEQLYSVSRRTLRRRLQAAGVHVASIYHRELELTAKQDEHLVELIDGLVLGDGYLEPRGNLQLTQTGSARSWLDRLKPEFEALGLSGTIHRYAPRTSVGSLGVIHTKESFRFSTTYCENLRRQQKRWYRPCKRVPCDVRLTPLSVALWFCGDGSYNQRGTLSFGTCAFSIPDVKRLQRGLADLGVRTTRCTTSKNHNLISVSRLDDSFALSKLIKPYIPACFDYKLAHVRPLNSVHWKKS